MAFLSSEHFCCHMNQIQFPVGLCTWERCRRPWWAERSPCAEIPPPWPRSHLRWCPLRTHTNNMWVNQQPSGQDALQSTVASITAGCSQLRLRLILNEPSAHVQHKCGGPCMCSRGKWLVTELQSPRWKDAYINTLKPCVFIYLWESHRSTSDSEVIRGGVNSHAWLRPLWGFSTKPIFLFQKPPPNLLHAMKSPCSQQDTGNNRASMWGM